jgi:hypothetical protein
MDESKETIIEFRLNEHQKRYLEKIIKELYDSESLNSERIDEFLKLTIFIVLYEYEKNKHSLNEFYKKNKELYEQNKDSIFN